MVLLLSLGLLLLRLCRLLVGLLLRRLLCESRCRQSLLTSTQRILCRRARSRGRGLRSLAAGCPPRWRGQSGQHLRCTGETSSPRRGACCLGRGVAPGRFGFHRGPHGNARGEGPQVIRRWRRHFEGTRSPAPLLQDHRAVCSALLLFHDPTAAHGLCDLHQSRAIGLGEMDRFGHHLRVVSGSRMRQEAEEQSGHSADQGRATRSIQCFGVVHHTHL
mmetsp:Transcript_53262/g.127398  ORF Transcript_53262/g.127398 Transcript_53262/m.127398 type:complete len:218 (-) Transcript_53262:740-1393(-)